MSSWCPLPETERLAHLVWPDHVGANGFHDGDGALDELLIGRKLPLGQPEVVLKADTNVAACQYSRRHVR